MTDIPLTGFHPAPHAEADQSAAAPLPLPPAEPPPATASPPPRRGGRRKNGLKGRPKLHEPLHEPLREPVHSDQVAAVRTRHKDVGGRFHIPPELVARHLPGRSVEWKRHSLLGQEDPFYALNLKSVGWEPVQAYQFPGLMPIGYKGPIIRDGMMLYERPQELTDEARREQLEAAFDVIRTTERRLGMAGPGEMTRDHPDVQPRISKVFEPLAPRAKGY